jgi:hypothetical protein
MRRETYFSKSSIWPANTGAVYMSMDFFDIEVRRRRHPGWKLLRSDHASLLASFLHRVFVAAGARSVNQSALVELLDDDLYALRQRLGDDAFPKPSMEYLTDWSSDGNGWLRKFYVSGSDDPCYDLTSDTEKALAWVQSLAPKVFAGAESRVRTMFDLLNQIVAGSETDPAVRIADLESQRSAIDAQIASLKNNEFVIMDETAIKERFDQFKAGALDIGLVFREIENNFRIIDREHRAEIITGAGSKGAVVGRIVDRRTEIANSDQGKSFDAFMDFLMSNGRREEFLALLEKVLAIPAIKSSPQDPKIRRIVDHWREAAEGIQSIRIQLTRQLRCFLDDGAWMSNRRIMEIIQGIEVKSMALMSAQPLGNIMEIDDTSPVIDLLMERRLHVPPSKSAINSVITDWSEDEFDTKALYSHRSIDKEKLALNIRRTLKDKEQATLAEVCVAHPIEQGLAELMAYLQLTGDKGSFTVVKNEDVKDEITLSVTIEDGIAHYRRVQLPRCSFIREAP